MITDEKYYIFNKKNPIAPLSVLGARHNSQVIELTKEKANQLVEYLNHECGEETYFAMSESERMEWIQKPQFLEYAKQMDKISENIMDCPEINEIREKIYREKDKNINGLMIPFIAESNEDYENKLKEKLDLFIKQIDRPAFRKEGTLVKDVKDTCKKVLEAFDEAKNGRCERAEEIVAEILTDYKQYPFAVSELDKSYAFRGIAPFEELRQDWVAKEEYEAMLDGELNFFRARVVGAEETICDLDEINYLSYSKRDRAKDLRFSSNGKVCLYLGVTSYVCSKESRWNGKDHLYLSSFKFNEKGKKLKILNLVVLQALLNGMISRPGDNCKHKELHNAMIRVFPLVIATMFTVQTTDKERENNGEEFKAEYLLSQILMNAIQKVGIDGVAYLSRQGKNDFQYPQMVCLAIPVTDTNEKEEYGKLIHDYVMTKPFLFNSFEKDYQKKSYINESYPPYQKSLRIENYTSKVECDGQTMFYQDTMFSKMDDYLVNQIHLSPGSL